MSANARVRSIRWGLGAVVTCLIALTGCGGDNGGVVVTVTGLVADDGDLSGLAGATVKVGNLTSEPTPASGAFSVAGVGIGQREFTVTREGYLATTVVLNVPPGGGNLGTIYLRPVPAQGKGNVSGTVTDAGLPAVGATVTAGGQTARTKSDGSFVLYNLSPGNVRVTARLGGKSGTATASVVAAQTTSVVISINTRPPDPPVI